jgi:putative membrane protein insertion efficiency factor
MSGNVNEQSNPNWIRHEDKSKSVPLPIPVRVALLALQFYKAYLSFLFAGSCRFEPTCSQYAYQGIERFGVARGVWLGLKRLLRCHPLSGKFGYDPVPESDKGCVSVAQENAPAILANPSPHVPHEVHS